MINVKNFDVNNSKHYESMKEINDIAKVLSPNVNIDLDINSFKSTNFTDNEENKASPTEDIIRSEPDVIVATSEKYPTFNMPLIDVCSHVGRIRDRLDLLLSEVEPHRFSENKTKVNLEPYQIYEHFGEIINILDLFDEALLDCE